MNIYKNMMLVEGGGGGHIEHPYDIVSNGEQLIRLFNYIAAKANEPTWLRDYASTKIDGVNGIFKLCHYEGTLQFGLDRGSADELDVQGVSVKEIPSRFKGEDRPVFTMALQMLNRMLPYIYKNLEALGMEANNQIGLNCDINMPGVTNVVKYESQYPFITIHGMVEMVVKPESKRGARKSIGFDYDQATFKEMIAVMDQSAQKKNWRIFHKIPVGVKKVFNLDAPLKWNVEVAGNRGSFRRFISSIESYNSKDVTVKNYKKVFINKEDAEANEVDGAIIFLANMGMGQYILDNLKFSDLATQHEGLIIYDPELKQQIKITGNFMVNRLDSPFAKASATESVQPISESTVLKTMKGTPIKRYKNNVGKQIGPQIYVHKNYASDIIPSDLWQRVTNTLDAEYPNFNYNCVMYNNKKPNIVRFDESPDFDSASEPTTGRVIYVNGDGTTLLGNKGNPYNSIWHHKWLWVKDDYTGFDVQDSKDWSENWLSRLPVSAKGGSHANWEDQLAQYNIIEGIQLFKNFVS